MSLELVNTLATFGTFLVIAATAIAAVVQLRHARSSNQIAALSELRETMETPDFLAAQQFAAGALKARMQEPAFRYQYQEPTARTDETRPLIAKINALGNFYEGMGLLKKTGLVDRGLVFELFSYQAISTWEELAPLAAIARRRLGDALWENFEYLAGLSQEYIERNPQGALPKNARRMPRDPSLLARYKKAAQEDA